MQKLYSILLFLAFSASAIAQVVPGADMETWRANTAHYGTFPTRVVHAPYSWFGFDSLIVYEGEYIATASFGTVGNGNNYFSQVFQEDTIIHGGLHAAKLITMKQDTIGTLGGSIANYHTNVSVNLTSGSITYFLYGGLPVTQRMHSVSAWIQYKYHTGAILDTAQISVSAQKHFGTIDSTIGSGSVNINATSVWQQVTANITYNDAVSIPDTIRITISSSLSGTVDSSTLYVDDVTMMNAVGVEKTILSNELVNVYPNPATNQINLECNTLSELKFEMYNVNGQLVKSKNISGIDAIDISKLSTGLYFYNISDNTSTILQKGKLNIEH